MPHGEGKKGRAELEFAGSMAKGLGKGGYERGINKKPGPYSFPWDPAPIAQDGLSFSKALSPLQFLGG